MKRLQKQKTRARFILFVKDTPSRHTKELDRKKRAKSGYTKHKNMYIYDR